MRQSKVKRFSLRQWAGGSSIFRKGMIVRWKCWVDIWWSNNIGSGGCSVSSLAFVSDVKIQHGTGHCLRLSILKWPLSVTVVTFLLNVFLYSSFIISKICTAAVELWGKPITT